jgi:hypothetical protein
MSHNINVKNKNKQISLLNNPITNGANVFFLSSLTLLPSATMAVFVSCRGPAWSCLSSLYS